MTPNGSYKNIWHLFKISAAFCCPEEGASWVWQMDAALGWRGQERPQTSFATESRWATLDSCGPMSSPLFWQERFGITWNLGSAGSDKARCCDDCLSVRGSTGHINIQTLLICWWAQTKMGRQGESFESPSACSEQGLRVLLGWEALQGSQVCPAGMISTFRF